MGQNKWGRFHQHFTSSFYERRPQKSKKTLLNWLSFFAFGICMLHVKRWWNLLMVFRRVKKRDSFLIVTLNHFKSKHHFLRHQAGIYYLILGRALNQITLIKHNRVKLSKSITYFAWNHSKRKLLFLSMVKIILRYVWFGSTGFMYFKYKSLK